MNSVGNQTHISWYRNKCSSFLTQQMCRMDNGDKSCLKEFDLASILWPLVKTKPTKLSALAFLSQPYSAVFKQLKMKDTFFSLLSMLVMCLEQYKYSLVCFPNTIYSAPSFISL